MSHPHVLRFVGVCVEPPNLCLVTEYMAGGSLFDLLHGTGCAHGPAMRRVAPHGGLGLAGVAGG